MSVLYTDFYFLFMALAADKVDGHALSGTARYERLAAEDKVDTVLDSHRGMSIS